MKSIQKNRLFISLIIIFNLLLRLPSLFDPVSYGDECIYLTLGNALRHGLVFYRDIHDNKPPLLYLVSALAGAKLFWLRLMTILVNTTNIWLIYKLGKLVLKKERAGLTAALLFTFFSLLPEGRIANGEIFMIMPATLGVWLGIKALREKGWLLWFLSGLSFSFAFLFKVPVIFDFVGFLVSLFLFPRLALILAKKDFSKLLLLWKNKRLGLVLAGFSLPILISIIYYTIKGAFTPYVRSALLQNIGYLSSWGGVKWGLGQRLIILLIITVIIFLWRERLKLVFYLPALMTLFGFYGVFLSERPYPHYLIEVAPWLALLLTVIIFQRTGWRPIIVCLLILFLGTLGVKKYKFWWYPQLPYYRNFLRFAAGTINKQDFFVFFGTKVLNDYEIARYLKGYTQPDERVFIWGDGACIYSLAERLPPGRYTVNYHLYDFDGFEETFKAIEEKKPNLIVQLEPFQNKFPQLESLLSTDFVSVKKIGEAKIYQRIIP